MNSKILAIAGGICLFLIYGCSGTRPTNLGVTNGRFAPCPDSPNCVSSQLTDESHAIAPIDFTGDPQLVWASLKMIVKAQSRVTIINEQDNYLYAEFKSALWGFVDDVEFYLNQDTSKIEMRSASRLGYSDMGINRKRIETIRLALKNKLLIYK